MDPLRIDEKRFKRDFDRVCEFGATGDGGVHRPTFSAAHLEARDWFRDRIEQDGFEFCCDGAGNHSARLTHSNSASATSTLLLGSHLDSVPYGGRFDGALGVIAAYEVLRTVRDAGIWFKICCEVDIGRLAKALVDNPH